MKLITTAKSVLRSIAQKRARRRSRMKGGAEYRERQTAAQRLIQSNYGLTYRNPPPERAGEKRAAARLAEHRRQWK